MRETTLNKTYERYFAQEEKLRRLVFHWVPEDTTSLLDLGCKAGNITSSYQKKAKSVAAVDKDYDAVLSAKRRFPDLKLFAGRAEELPIKTGCFHILVASEVLQYLSEPQRAVAEMHRVLKPGGLLILSVPQKGPCYQLANPGNITDRWRNKKFLSSMPLRIIHYSLPALKELLKGRFTIEETYQGGTILYPYSSLLLWYLVQLCEKDYDRREIQVKNRSLIKVYYHLLDRCYIILNKIVQGIMKIDFSIQLGKYSYNIVLRAMRD